MPLQDKPGNLDVNTVPPLEVWPISKMITDRGVKNKNVPEIQKQYEH